MIPDSDYVKRDGKNVLFSFKDMLQLIILSIIMN
jgi:hypothetical protein